MRLHQSIKLAFALVPSDIYPLGARPASRTIFALLDRLGLNTVHHTNLVFALGTKSFIMLQHAQMSHAFQSTATGVSILIETAERA